MGDKMLNNEYSSGDFQVNHPESNSQFSSSGSMLFDNIFEKGLETCQFMAANKKEELSNDVLDHMPADLKKGIDVLLDLNNKVKKISFTSLNTISTDDGLIDQYIWSIISELNGNYSTEMYKTKMKSTQQEEISHMVKSMEGSLSYSMLNELKESIKDAAIRLNLI